LTWQKKPSDHEKKVARLKQLYQEGRIDKVLIPENPSLKRFVEDLKSGSSEAERALDSDEPSRDEER
jgi:hypothetical protein